MRKLICSLAIAGLLPAAHAQQRTVTFQVLGNDYVETYFPSLGGHNRAGGLEPSDKVHNFLPKVMVNPDAHGAKPDSRGNIVMKAAPSPYYRLDRLRLYLLPGDKLVADMKGKRYPWMIRFAGRHAAENSWWNQELMNVYQPMTPLQYAFDTLQSYYDYSAMIRKNAAVVTQQLDALKATPAFRMDALARVQGLQIYALLNYWAHHQEWTTTPVSAATRDSILQEVSALVPKPYKTAYNDFPEVVMALEYLARFDSAYVARQAWPGFNTLHTLMQVTASNAFLYNNQLTALAKQVEDPALKAILQQWWQTYGHLQQGQPAPDILLKDKDGKLVKLSSFKGKKLYVDFWATWCNPCLALKPAYEALAASYTSQDSLVFITISQDKDEAHWKHWLETHPAPANVHEFIAVDIKQVEKQYQMQYIPRFILLDSRFRFLSARAPRPGETSLDTLLGADPGITKDKKTNG